MIDPTLDGIEHVNIYSQGNTELGKMLSNFYRFEINTVDGKFNSVEGYWFWLGIDDCPDKEQLRILSGYSAKRIGSMLKSKCNKREDLEFENKILKAIWYKARRNAHLFRSPIAILPFEHYYNYGGKIVDVKDKYIWMIDGIDKMRNHILS